MRGGIVGQLHQRRQPREGRVGVGGGLHGEQGALLATAKIVQTVPWEEAKFYAANQVADEARHVEVYHRYLTEKLGVSYAVSSNLRTLLDDILCDRRWDSYNFV